MLRNIHIKVLSLALLVGMTSMLISCGGAEDRKAKYFESGMELYEEGNYVKARLEFRNVLQIDPKDVEGLFMYGHL
jgi:Tfp pilus assembly protein PilF